MLMVWFVFLKESQPLHVSLSYLLRVFHFATCIIPLHYLSRWLKQACFLFNIFSYPIRWFVLTETLRQLLFGYQHPASVLKTRPIVALSHYFLQFHLVRVIKLLFILGKSRLWSKDDAFLLSKDLPERGWVILNRSGHKGIRSLLFLLVQ